MIRSLIAGTVMLPFVAAGADDSPPGVPASTVGTDATELAKPPAPGEIAEWAAASGDNRGLPFLVVDKTYAQLYVFDATGELQGVTPVTITARRGSEPVARRRPQVDDRPPADRIRPAGRFVVEAGRRDDGVIRFSQGFIEIPVVSYGSAVDNILAGNGTVVYILPVTRRVAGIFPDDVR